MLCSDFPWNKHVYKTIQLLGYPHGKPPVMARRRWLMCPLHRKSPGTMVGKDWCAPTWTRGSTSGALGTLGFAGIGMWMKQSLYISIIVYHGMNLKYWQCRICSRMNTMEFWETRMIVSLFSVISRSHIVESRVMESYPVLPLQYLYVVVVSCRIFGVTMIYHSYFYRCF